LNRHRIQCAEIWGGIHDQEQDVCSAGIEASIYSSSCDGGKGGDIYYLSVCESDMLTRIAVADVMGHGQSVSHISQFIFDALKSHMNDTSGDGLLGAVNRLAVKKGLDALTTAVVAAFYTADNNLYFSYAGHHPILVKRSSDNGWIDAYSEQPENGDASSSANLPLTIANDTVFIQQSMPLTTGDRLFLYTDGIIEAPDRQRNLFGIDRLRRLLNDQDNAPLQDLRTAVLDTLRNHTGGKFSHDDVTLLALEIR
jgi:sigma-B regulation protein RsbU (phosphoserine phosphatase)